MYFDVVNNSVMADIYMYLKHTKSVGVDFETHGVTEGACTDMGIVSYVMPIIHSVFYTEPVPVSYVVPSIHPVFYIGTSTCILCHAKYTPSVLYWNQCLYPMSCQLYTQCFIRNQCLYPMSCQVYTQCFILEPVPVSYVVPSIHPVFYTGTSTCIICRAKYPPSLLYWNQCLYPMSCQLYTQCFILEPVPVSCVVPSIHPVFYMKPVPVSYFVPSIHPVFYTGTSACILCRAKYTPSVLYWNQNLYPMSCQVYTQCFIRDQYLYPMSCQVSSIHQVFNTGTSACVLCHAKYTPSVLYWNQCLYPMSCQVYTQCFILKPVPVTYVMPSIHPVFYSTCIPCRAKYTPSVLYWNQCLYPMSCQVYTQCFILEPVPVSHVVPSIHPVFYTGPSACILCRTRYTPSVLYWNQYLYPMSCQIHTQCFIRNQCLYPMSCQVYTQCFILEPVPVSCVVPSIHPVFYMKPVPVS